MRRSAIVALLGLLAGSPAWSEDGAQIRGRVINENGAPLPGVKLVVRNTAGAILVEGYTDPAGDYSIALAGPGEYLVDLEKSGHFPLRDQALSIVPGTNDSDFILNRTRELFESVEVVAAPPPINMDTTETRETVTGNEIVNVPYPRSNNLKNALRIVPGVVQDGRGRLHVNGGKEEQTLYTLNGFNISDPLTGRFDSRMSVESVQTVDVTSGRISAEYGKGSAGVLAINTKTGDDKFRYSATNFFPGIEYQKKGVVVGNWTPRLNVSGPIKQGRAWFSNSFDALYVNTVVKELPVGEDRSSSWRLSDHISTQVNLTPSNILYAGLLMNIFTAPRYGLTVLDPRETTVDQRARQWFFHIKDQIYLPNRILIEVGYAANRTFGREIPQGQNLYQITPDGRRGNYFLDATREGSRDQIIANVFLPEFELFGEHRVKVGTDLNRLRYWQDAQRTGFENYGRDFIRTRSTVFGGDGVAEIRNYEASFYLQDSWRVRPGLLIELGLRSDWDQILHYTNISPRFGFAWQPPGLRRTKISGGFGVIHDATNLRVFTRPLDQYSMTTYFDDDGEADRGPALTIFTIQNPRPARPRYFNWSLGLEQEFGGGVHGRFEVMRKRGRYGFTYVNAYAPGKPVIDGLLPQINAIDFTEPQVDALYSLTNDRQDDYQHVRVTIRKTIKRKYEVMASYTRSRARSNAVIDANIDEPVTVDYNFGPMPWDAPDRVVSWAYLPTPFKDWSLAYLVEYRTGFPFSIVDDDGRVMGQVNQRRFPSYFQLNVHLERRFVLKNHMWAFRAGCNNVTNRSNPSVVNNSVSSEQFLQFHGGADRSFNFRLRWLGRSAK